MPPSQQGRNPRKKDVPRAFMLSWQASGAGGPKPLVRRPMTACEACRNSKVKCNGEQDCERCSSRGMCCTYTHLESRTADPTRQTTTHRPASNSSTSVVQNQVSPEPTMMNFDLDGAEAFGMPDVTYDQGDDGVTERSQGTNNQQFDDFEWSPSDFNIHDQTFDFSTIPSSPADWDMFQTLPHAPSQFESTQTTSSSHPDSHNTSIASVSTSSALSLIQESSSGNNKCQCLARLQLPASRVKIAMQERPHPRLDRVFQVTGDVIRSCQDMIDCADCQISCSDLLCILAIFQQTEPCFEYITRIDAAAASRASGAIKVSVGEYNVDAVDDVRVRGMLVMSLVRQAGSILDSLSVLGRDAFASQQSAVPCRLSRINLEYLLKVVEKFKGILRSITDSLDEAA